MLSEYVLRVGAVVIFSMLMEALMPSSAIRKYVKLLMSLLLIFTLVQPVIGWIQGEVSLEVLTLGEDEQVQRENPYEEQAQAMMQEAYETAFMNQGLPASLQDRYSLLDVKVGEKVQVTISKEKEIGDLADRELSLGQIGRNLNEEEQMRQSLCEYWGVPEESLEMRLR